ncbi:MAG: hypothetical protein II336_17905 [Loktanella sp.]|nr:hypothetical protein [Loktanella sp.]
MNDALKPCPLCWSSQIEDVMRTGAVECQDCGTSAPNRQVWNTRAAAPVVAVKGLDWVSYGERYEIEPLCYAAHFDGVSYIVEWEFNGWGAFYLIHGGTKGYFIVKPNTKATKEQVMAACYEHRSASVLSTLNITPAAPLADVKLASDEVKAFLADVVGVVEANSFETMCLWQNYRGGRNWVSHSSGFGATVGTFGGKPVFISLTTATVDGQKVLFIDPTSEVVSWQIIDAWLDANIPSVAKRADGRVNKVDAMNFPNVFRAAIEAQP